MNVEKYVNCFSNFLRMKMKLLLSTLILACSFPLFAQTVKQPVQITLKNGETLDAVHFGQIKCGTEIYGDNYIIIRGKFMDAVSEIKDYKDIEKIVLEGYSAAPAASVGNEAGTLRIFKKDGVSVTLTDAELVMSCYGPGDLYNTLVVQIMNPLSNQPSEQAIETRNIQSIIFK
jgi:hypothetical protein